MQPVRLATGGMLFLALGAARYLLIAVPLIAIWFVPVMILGAGRYARPSWRRPSWHIAAGYARLAVVAPIVILEQRSAGRLCLPIRRRRLLRDFRTPRLPNWQSAT